MVAKLRQIAEQVLDQRFPGLSTFTRNDWAPSLVRQWLGHGGVAVLLTQEFNFWFHLKRLDDGQTQVVCAPQPQSFVDHLRKSRVFEKDIPGLLHELSIRQSVDCRTDYGQKLRLRVNPSKLSFHIELVLDDKEWHRCPNE